LGFNYFMKKALSILFFVIINYSFGQINYEESTFQAITFWDLKEKQNYDITISQYRIVKNDSILKNKIKYQVEIIVIDSTAKNYEIEWHFKNFVTTSNSKIKQEIDKIYEGIKIKYKTDELGVFEKITNLESVRKQIQKKLDNIKKENKSLSDLGSDFTKLEFFLKNKNSLENLFAKDINQFHYFHGVAFELNESQSAKMEVPNLLGGKPFDADITFEMTDINSEYEFAVLRMEQVVNSVELKKSVIEFLKKTRGYKGDYILEELKNEIRMATSMHNTGWPIYSSHIVDINLGDEQTVEIREIELIVDEN
jgi:hypothetical protein